MIERAREMGAVGFALLLYRARIVPAVREQLGGWRRLAAAIGDPGERELARAAIDEKGLNVEATAVFATLAPRRHRPAALRAMVALQVAIDYLDSVGERGGGGDAEYLELLFGRTRAELRTLPAAAATEPAFERAVARCGEGQHHTHLAEHGDRDALRAWAEAQPAPDSYHWWEVAAGASSSVAAHALIAAAADRHTTVAAAALVDAAYFPPVGALTVLLDDLVDRAADAAAGAHDYLRYYSSEEEAAARLELLTVHASAALQGLPRPRRHLAILVGVLGFYLSAPAAWPRPIHARVLTAAGPAVRPVVAFARRRQRKRLEGAGNTSEP